MSRPAPPPSAPPPPPPGSLLLTVVTWLTGISTWNRAAIALVLGGAFLTGLLVYRNTAEVLELLREVLLARHESAERPGMTHFVTDIQRQANVLLATFGPQMIGVTVWRVDRDGNQLTLVRAAVAPEFAPTEKQLEAQRWRWPVAFFGENATINDVLARVSIGRFVCTAPAGTWDALERFPLAEICLVAIPPEGGAIGGMIAGAWHTPIGDDDRPRVEMAFRAAADVLTWRPARPAAW